MTYFDAGITTTTPSNIQHIQSSPADSTSNETETVKYNNFSFISCI